MVILLFILILNFKTCSVKVSTTPSTLLNWTYSTIYKEHTSCPCNDVDPSEYCIVEQMFSSVTFFREGTTKLVCQNVSATVSPVYEKATLQTMSQFEVFNDKCLTETIDSESDFLSINGRNQCSSSYRCCVMCVGCPQRRMLNDVGSVILKDIIDVSVFKTNIFTLLMKCATNSPMATAGHQFFSLRFSNREWTLNESSTVLPTTSTSSHTRKTTDLLRTTVWTSSAIGSTLGHSTALGGTARSSLSTLSTVEISSVPSSIVSSSAIGNSLRFWPTTVGTPMRFTSLMRKTAESSLATSHRWLSPTGGQTQISVPVSMSSSAQKGSDNLTTTIMMTYKTTTISFQNLKCHNAGHNLSVETVVIIVFKLALLPLLAVW